MNQSENIATPKGIKCPACGTAEQYAGGANEKRPDNSIYRKKQCKACESWFATLEVPVGCIEVKTRKRGTNEDAITEAPQ